MSKKSLSEYKPQMTEGLLYLKTILSPEQYELLLGEIQLAYKDGVIQTLRQEVQKAKVKVG